MELPFSDDSFLPELYTLVQLYKPRHTRYALNETVQLDGHDIIRLPPYHPDLNHIKLICVEVLAYVAKRNTSYLCLKFKLSEKTRYQVWTPKNAAAEPQIDNIIESFIASVGDGSDTDSSDTPLLKTNGTPPGHSPNDNDQGAGVETAVLGPEAATITFLPPDHRLPVSLFQMTRRDVKESAEIDFLVSISLSPVMVFSVVVSLTSLARDFCSHPVQ
ncbi:hypothetical protein J6590_089231 [Homalodisca vitripennis]|nr:hypothetical protein J6590_089231 [Homalodisca vitripennis]